MIQLPKHTVAITIVAFVCLFAASALLAWTPNLWLMPTVAGFGVAAGGSAGDMFWVRRIKRESEPVEAPVAQGREGYL